MANFVYGVACAFALAAAQQPLLTSSPPKTSFSSQCWGHGGQGGDCRGLIDQAIEVLSPMTGPAQCWGDEEYGGNCAGMDLSGATHIFSTRRAFLAVNSTTGFAQCWGNVSCTGINFTGVTHVFSTDRAFLALNAATGTGQCWGDVEYGGECSGIDFEGVKQIFSTAGAFLILRIMTDHVGNVNHVLQSWGRSDYGGGVYAVISNSSGQVFSNDRAFVIVEPGTDTAICIGDSTYGGDCTAIDFSADTQVFATDRAFVALNTATGTGQCWGDEAYGGECSGVDFRRIARIYPSADAFLAFADLDDGSGGEQAYLWGNGEYSQLNDTSGKLWYASDSKSEAFASDSTFMFVGERGADGNISSIGCLLKNANLTCPNLGELKNLGLGDAHAFTTTGAFLVLSGATGAAKCWGDAADASNCTGIDFKGVTQVLSTRRAFLALQAPLPEPEVPSASIQSHKPAHAMVAGIAFVSFCLVVS